MIRKSFFKYKLALSKDNAILLKVRMIFEKKIILRKHFTAANVFSFFMNDKFF